MSSPLYWISKHHKKLGHRQRKTSKRRAPNFPPQRLFMFNRSLFMRQWQDWAWSLQTEQSAFQTKIPNDKRLHVDERVWFSLLINVWQRSVVECCSLCERFSPGGLPCMFFQNCVAGYESPDKSRPPVSSSSSLLSFEASSWQHGNLAHATS